MWNIVKSGIEDFEEFQIIGIDDVEEVIYKVNHNDHFFYCLDTTEQQFYFIDHVEEYIKELNLANIHINYCPKCQEKIPNWVLLQLRSLALHV